MTSKVDPASRVVATRFERVPTNSALRLVSRVAHPRPKASKDRNAGSEEAGRGKC